MLNKGGCEKQIRRRFTFAKAAEIKLTKIWRDTDIIKATKRRLANTVIYPIATYVDINMDVKKADANSINAFELRLCRSIPRIPWTIYHESVLQQLNIETLTQDTLRVERRHNKTDCQREGRRSKIERQSFTWPDQIKTFIGYTLPETSHEAQNREEWHTTIL